MIYSLNNFFYNKCLFLLFFREYSSCDVVNYENVWSREARRYFIMRKSFIYFFFLNSKAMVMNMCKDADYV